MTLVYPTFFWPKLISSQITLPQNCTLDEKCHPLCDFPNLKYQKLSLSRLAKKIFDSMKNTRQYNIAFVFPKKFNQELSPTLAKLFIRCPLKKCVPVCVRRQLLALPFQNRTLTTFLNLNPFQSPW